MAKRITKLGGKSRTILPDYYVTEWEGLNTYIKDLKQLSDGQSPDSLNWLTGKFKDHIELRRGYALLGTTRNTGTGRITGIGVAQTYAGVQVPFFSYGQSLKYYNSTSGDTAEIGTNVLPAAASGEDISFMQYQNLAGAFMYATSPNSSIYKLDVLNLGSYSDLLSTAFRGNAKIDSNRMFMWNRRDNYRQQYQNVLYIGVSDKSDVTQYTQTTAENPNSLSGDGLTKAFSGTLAYRAASAKKTCFGTEFAAPIASGVAVTGITAATQAVVTVSSHSLVVGDAVLINGVVGMTQINNLIGIVMATTGTTITLSINSSAFTAYASGGNIYKAEYFIDDLNGALSSKDGGTGTINYTTGAFTLAFNTAPITGQNIYSQYYTEDATSGGVADFTIDGATTGKGKTFIQSDGGGAIQNVFPFDQVQYCFHALKTWYLTLTSDDTKATNLPYRSQLGIPYLRGGFATDDGIIFLDNSNPAQPKVKILTVSSNTASSVLTVVPTSVSDKLDLSSFGFTKVAVTRWGDYDLVACEAALNGVVQSVNTVVFARNIYTGSWDLLDYAVSCFEQYNGALIAGDSLSNNVFTLFSGFDDDTATIANHWNSKLFDLGVQGLKKFYRFYVRGLIQSDQNIDIYLSYDDGSFTKVATVAGTGSYVDTTTPVNVGSNTIGSQVIGGGGGAVSAYPYEVEFSIASDQFEYVQVQFQANNIGYCQIDEFAFKDCRYKGRRILPVHSTETT